MKLNPMRVGVSLGALMGLWHLTWSGLVAAGLAKPLMDFVLMIHFIRLDIGFAPFDVQLAARLVVVTSLFGFAFGWVFAVVWNSVTRRD
jgi:hypothetical protein